LVGRRLFWVFSLLLRRRPEGHQPGLLVQLVLVRPSAEPLSAGFCDNVYFDIIQNSEFFPPIFINLSKINEIL
jgi:hypothetical protein